MSTFYKYAERDAVTQINWTEIGQNISDTLNETARVRQEKKDAIDAATREFENNLANAPQGQNQDINNFTNSFAHKMMEQMRIDEQLLKSGQMPLEKYTLRRNNYLDGTNQLFELSKLYQAEYEKTMQGVVSGDLQALNAFNMSMVEGYSDFTNSEAVIDSLGDGRVNIGLYETKIVDGKPMKVLSKNIAPVNVVRGKILQKIPSFNVEDATNKSVAAFGTRKENIYRAATISGAGSVTELLGIGAMEKYPEFAGIIKEMNEAINNQIGSYFANPYNLTSVLTQNLGTYSAQSFTFDKEEAAKDKGKILVKVDPQTGLTALDTDGPNYASQKKEAEDWVRNNIMSKLDRETSVKTTPQAQLQERSPEGNRRMDMKAQAKAFAEQLVKLTVGNANDALNSLPYFQALLDRQGAGTITRTNKGIEVDTGGGKIVYAFEANGKLQNPLALQKQLVTALNVNNLNEDDISRELVRLRDPRAVINQTTTGTGYAPEEDLTNKVAQTISSRIKTNFFDKSSAISSREIRQALADIPNLTVTDKGGTFGNNIEIKLGKNAPITINSREDAAEQIESISKYISSSLDRDAALRITSKTPQAPR